MPPRQTHELHIALTEDDRPEDRFATHVNNARYFAFINRTLHGWYVAMGIRNPGATHTAAMAHMDYDFLHQVFVPGAVRCRIEVVQVGRSSLTHAVQMWDVGSGEPRLAGRGRTVHVWMDRSTGQSLPWPAELLAQCWRAEPDGAGAGLRA